MSTVIDGSAGITTNAGGSVNPSTNIDGINFSCRAWVEFNGSGTVAIRASGNVSSITDNGAGDYTVNFTTAMTDANYSAVGSSGFLVGNQVSVITSSYARTPNSEVAPTAAAYRFSTLLPGTSAGADVNYVNMAFFR